MGYWDDLRFNPSVSDDEDDSDDTASIVQQIQDGLSTASASTFADSARRLSERVTLPVRLNQDTIGDTATSGSTAAAATTIVNVPQVAASRTEVPFAFCFQQYSTIDTPVKWYSNSAKYQNNPINGRVVLPVTPENFTTSSTNEQVDVTSIVGLTYTHAGPVGLMEIDIECFFPAAQDANFVHPLVRTFGFFDPPSLCAKFNTAMNSGQPILFTVSDPSDTNPVAPSMIVTVTEFNWEMRHGYGKDRFITMTLREWIPQLIYSGGFSNRGYTNITVGTKAGGNKKNLVPRKLGKIADFVHTHVDTDFAAPPWQTIYTLNKKKIDAIIKKNKKLGVPRASLTLPVGTILRVPA